MGDYLSIYTGISCHTGFDYCGSVNRISLGFSDGKKYGHIKVGVFQEFGINFGKYFGLRSNAKGGEFDYLAFPVNLNFGPWLEAKRYFLQTGIKVTFGFQKIKIPLTLRGEGEEAKTKTIFRPLTFFGLTAKAGFRIKKNLEIYGGVEASRLYYQAIEPHRIASNNPAIRGPTNVVLDRNADVNEQRLVLGLNYYY